MKLLSISLLSAVAVLLGLAVQPPSASASISPPAAQVTGASTIVVEIQTRGAPDKPITWTGGKKKERCFRLYCAESYLHPITSICVEFSSGTTPLQLADMFRAEIEEAILDEDRLALCDYSVQLVNNSLIITGIGADRFSGSADEPVYEGESGEDFTEDHQPKKSPFCRLAIVTQ